TGSRAAAPVNGVGADLLPAWQAQQCGPASYRNSRQQCLTTQAQPTPEAVAPGYPASRENRWATGDQASRRWDSRRHKSEQSGPVPRYTAGVLSDQGRN